MIDASDLAAMRSQMNATHDGTLIIRRPTRSSNGEGGYTTTYAPVTGGTVTYRAVQVTGLERAMAGRMGTVSYWRFGLPLSPEVLPKDILYDGTVPVWQVVNTNIPRSIALEQLVDCVRY